MPTPRSLLVPTSRLAVHATFAGPEDAPTLVLIHGNASSGAFFDRTQAALGDAFHVIAPDLRGYGRTEPAPIDATRGVRDFADDLHALLEATGRLGRPLYLVGWSVGGGVAMQYAIDHAAQVTALVLEAPMSPWGFGGTRDVKGTPCHADYAGSGGGTANPEFVRLLAAGDRGVDNPTSPRNVMTQFYVKPPFAFAADDAEAYLSAVLQMRTGDDHYPGDTTASPNWPGVAPGSRGMNNAISPKYCDLSGFAKIDPRPPVLWIRGADDAIVSDASFFDFGHLGKLGFVPGWPGDAVYPAQPMIAQTRAVLSAYAEAGGRVREEVFEDCGHSPHLERPERFLAAVRNFVAGA